MTVQQWTAAIVQVVSPQTSMHQIADTSHPLILMDTDLMPKWMLSLAMIIKLMILHNGQSSQLANLGVH